MIKIGRTKIHISTLVIFPICALFAFIFLVPFAWMLSASFKNNIEIFEYPIRWIPAVIRTENYVKVWTDINFLQYYTNTVRLAVVITVIQLFTSSLAAYSFSKLRFPGRDKLFLGYLGTMMVPWHAILIPQFIVVRDLGLYNTHLGLVALNAFSAFGVFLLRQNMISIPDSLHEAAKLDGCSYFRVYWNIVLPLTKTGMAVLTILTFNSTWNNYMQALIFLQSDHLQVIQVGLALFRQEFTTDFAPIMAGTVCAIIPVVIVYTLAQKHIIEGVAFSGIKG
ncbi:MAG: carbohydrate ABC transporter permease [Oscillospiraceae bacterium]|nr:carbohydrate ABC transporter permease [Oscillospiraceae bacterium]